MEQPITRESWPLGGWETQSAQPQVGNRKQIVPKKISRFRNFIPLVFKKTARTRRLEVSDYHVNS